MSRVWEDMRKFSSLGSSSLCGIPVIVGHLTSCPQHPPIQNYLDKFFKFFKTPPKINQRWIRQGLKKQRHHFSDKDSYSQKKKDSYSQSYGFSSSHVWMGQLDHKEGWVPKNWCFRTIVLEKTLRVPWIVGRSNQPILREINPEYLLEGLTLRPKLQYFGHLMWRAD